MLKIGIAGLGVISGVHLPVIRSLGKEARITAVCDCDIRKRDLVEEAVFYSDLEQMLKQEQLDCLHICLPHYLHVPAVRLAAAAGVAVFLEKPAGLHPQEIDLLLQDADVGKIPLGVCLQHRYDGATLTLLELLRSGSYGRVLGCKAVVTWNRPQEYYDKDLWRGRIDQAGGGVMLSQAIHTMDLMGLFCGKPVWTKGMMGNLFLEHIGVEDTACSITMFEDDVRAVFYGTVTHCQNSSVELELVTEKGVFRIKDNALTLQQEQKEVLLAKDRTGAAGKDYYGSGHGKAIREFYQQLTGSGGSCVSLKEARKVSVLIAKITESSTTGKRVYFDNHEMES